ncbi:MAG TPA: hypothetical protein VFQ39_15470 [Longimicrobium sp.]|nr:hypothetical protein [Longimicrobium sp.]
MAKLRLAVDALQVQSFTTQSTVPTRGTVRGAESDVVEAPTVNYWECHTQRNCESGDCMGTLEASCLTLRCSELCSGDCPLEPWTAGVGQDTCQTCATCPGIPGC